MQTRRTWITEDEVAAMFPDRDPSAHKGNFGHSLIVAGKKGMMGAALLAAGGALRSGCGLVTCHVPVGERLAMQISHPSAILSLDFNDCFSEFPVNMARFTAVCVGPGLGQAPETAAALGRLLESGLPMVLDADALNLISSNPEFFSRIPPDSVLTPHAGELERLLKAAVASSVIRGCCNAEENLYDEEKRTGMVKALSLATGAVIVVKGHNTMVCAPDGSLSINPVGNPGMAKGGSGDVLAGFMAGLLARGLSARDAAVAGVYLHGLAGDKAAAAIGEESMNASDILDFLRI